jgi:hypothetical protein
MRHTSSIILSPAFPFLVLAYLPGWTCLGFFWTTALEGFNYLGI